MLLFAFCGPARSAITLSLGNPVYASCGQVSINGIVLPSQGDTINQLSWDWGDGSTPAPSFFPASHRYTHDGAYSILVTATSLAGEKATASSSVTIRNSGDAACTTMTLSLTDSSYGACGYLTLGGSVTPGPGDVAGSIVWDWGDGSKPIPSFFPAIHKYPRDGVFNVQATAYSQQGTTASAVTSVAIRSTGDAACASPGPFYSTSTLAGVDFAAGETAPASALVLMRPTNIAVDQKDALYISDYDGSRVWRVTPEGVASLVAGGPRDYFIPAPGPAGVAYPPLAYPLDGPTALTFDNSGNPYILRFDPFNDKNAWIYKVNPQGISLRGTANPIQSFTFYYASFAADPADNLYLGDWYYGRILKLSPAGETTTLATGFRPQGIQWHNGLLYISSATCNGCAAPATIQTVDSKGNATTLFSSLAILSGLAVGSKGEAYFPILPGGLMTVALDGTMSAVPGGSAITQGDLAIDSSGAIYNVSVGGTIRRLAGGATKVVAGGGDQTVPARQSPLISPNGIAILPGGDVVVVDYTSIYLTDRTKASFANRMRRISANGHWSLISSPDLANPLNPPFALASQGATLIAVVDYPGYKIARFYPDGSSDLIGIGDINRISSISAVAPDGSGGYYLGGTGPNVGNAIWHVDSTGGLVQSPNLTAALRNSAVNDLSTDAAGNLYIAQSARVLKATPAGAISTVAGNGQPGYSGDNGPATAAQLNGVSGAAIDTAGNLFIADTANRRIRMVRPDGIIRTIAVTGPSQEVSDGFGGVRMDAPTKIATDGTNVYFSESTNGLVKKLTPNTPVQLKPAGGDGQSAPVGSALPASLIVQAIGTAGAPVEGLLTTWAVAAGSATLSAVTAVTDSGGLARVDAILGRAAGPVTITVSAPSLPPLTFTVTATAAATTDLTVTVPGTADPWLAGMAAGSKASCDTGTHTQCDGVPAQSPVLLMLQSGAGAAIDISATGTTSLDRNLAAQYFGPDGNPNSIVQHDSGAENGISDIISPMSALLGVFLGPDSPNLSPAPGPAADPARPGLKQVFLIGSRKTVIVPAGATRLFLGTMDIFQWVDNGGSFTVKVSATCPVNAGTCVSQPAAASSLKIVSGDNQTGTIGRALASPLVVQVIGAKGAPAAGVPVGFAVTSGSATLSASGATSASDGTAGTTLTLGPAAGVVAVTATAAGGPAVVFHATAIGGPQISSGGVVNAASPLPIAPGALATAYGQGFAAANTTNHTLPVPTVLAGVSVTVNGRAAPVTFVGTGQVNFQVPYETQPGTASVKVIVNGTESPAESVTVSPSAVGLFSIIQNQDYSLNLQSKPAAVGSYVTVYGTGGGAVTPAVATGEAAPSSPLSSVVGPVTATVNGVPAAIVFAGLTPANVGLLQFNIQIPPLDSGRYLIQITAAGVKSNTQPVWVGQ